MRRRAPPPPPKDTSPSPPEPSSQSPVPDAPRRLFEARAKREWCQQVRPRPRAPTPPLPTEAIRNASLRQGELALCCPALPSFEDKQTLVEILFELATSPPRALGTAAPASSGLSDQKSRTFHGLMRWTHLLLPFFPKIEEGALRARLAEADLGTLELATPIHLPILSALITEAQQKIRGDTGVIFSSPSHEWNFGIRFQRLQDEVGSHLAPFYRVLAYLGSVREVNRVKEELLRGIAKTATSSNRVFHSFGAVDLEILRWAGVEFCGIERGPSHVPGRTALHAVVAMAAKLASQLEDGAVSGRNEGEGIHRKQEAQCCPFLSLPLCIRSLLRQHPAALLQADGEGLTPLNYLAPPFRCATRPLVATSREVLLVLLEGLALCLRDCPAALEATIRSSEAFRVGLAGLNGLQDTLPLTWNEVKHVLDHNTSEEWACAFCDWKNTHDDFWDRSREVTSAWERMRAMTGACRHLSLASPDDCGSSKNSSNDDDHVGGGSGNKNNRNSNKRSNSNSNSNSNEHDNDNGSSSNVFVPESKRSAPDFTVTMGPFLPSTPSSSTPTGVEEGEEDEEEEDEDEDEEEEEDEVQAIDNQMKTCQVKWEEREAALNQRIAELREALGQNDMEQEAECDKHQGQLGQAGITWNGLPLDAANPEAGSGAGEDALGKDLVTTPTNVTSSGGEAESPERLAARQFVQKIRRLKLVDIDLSKEPPELVERATHVRESLVRALDRLALDLYEMESHFVYEVLQNADDNRYHEDVKAISNAASVPTLSLNLRRRTSVGKEACDYFFSVNNELGLSPEDLRAICDVNMSSKKGKKGVTGHKGIGWKSCFQVSGVPHLLSGPFTVKFDTEGELGKLGYVTPTWLTLSDLQQLPKEIQEAHAAGHTVVYLPLFPSCADAVAEALADMERHVASLLFLRRLRCLMFDYEGGQRTVWEREDEPPALPTSSGSNLWVTLRQTRKHRDMQTPNGGLAKDEVNEFPYFVHSGSVELPNEQRGQLSFAFFEKKSQDSEVEAPQPDKLPSQALYCSLPIRHIGFRFALNGPFELIASRGDIHEGSATNLGILQALPTLFAKAIAAREEVSSKKTSKTSERDGLSVTEALSLLGPEPVNRFWQRAHREMAQALSGGARLPVEGGKLARPEDCLIRPTHPKAAAAAQHISSDLLYAACKKHFVASGTSEDITGLSSRFADANAFGVQALRALGVEELQWKHWEEILSYRDAREDALPLLAEKASVWWESAKAGNSEGEVAANAFFEAFYNWLNEEFMSSASLNATLETLWPVELFPSYATPAKSGELLTLADQPLWLSFCEDVSEEWQKPLLEQGCLHLVAPQIARFLGAEDDDEKRCAGSKLSLGSLMVRKPARAHLACQCIQWHFSRFADSTGAHGTPSNSSLWHSLRCVREAHQHSDLPTSPAAFEALGYPVLARLFQGCRTETQLLKKLGQVLFCPTFAGLPSVQPVASLIWPNFCGISILSREDVQVPSMLARGSAEDEAVRSCQSSLGLRFPENFASNEVSGLEWEVFFCKLGMKMFNPAAPNMRDLTTTCGLDVALGTCFTKPDWWQDILESEHICQYVCEDILMAPHLRAWLSVLPVPGQAEKGADVLSEMLLHSAWSGVGGKYLPLLKLPDAYDQEAKRLESVVKGLATLGVATTVDESNLVRCLRSLQRAGCKDLQYYVEIYRNLGELDLRQANSTPPSAIRAGLHALPCIFVPGLGFIKRQHCSWKDHGIVAWLAKFVALEPIYGRFGAAVEHFFKRVLKLPHQGEDFTPSDSPESVVVAMKRFEKLVEVAKGLGPDQAKDPLLLEGELGPITAEVCLRNLRGLILRLFALAVRTLTSTRPGSPKLLHQLSSERLIFLEIPDDHVYRFSADEVWWDVDPDLEGNEKVERFCLKKHFGVEEELQHLGTAPEKMKEFFMRLGAHEAMTRAGLRTLLTRKYTPVRSPCWRGLTIDAIEDVTWERRQQQAARAAQEAERRLRAEAVAAQAAQDSEDANVAIVQRRLEAIALAKRRLEEDLVCIRSREEELSLEVTRLKNLWRRSEEHQQRASQPTTRGQEDGNNMQRNNSGNSNNNSNNNSSSSARYARGSSPSSMESSHSRRSDFSASEAFSNLFGGFFSSGPTPTLSAEAVQDEKEALRAEWEVVRIALNLEEPPDTSSQEAIPAPAAAGPAQSAAAAFSTAAAAAATTNGSNNSSNNSNSNSNNNSNLRTANPAVSGGSPKRSSAFSAFAAARDFF